MRRTAPIVPAAAAFAACGDTRADVTCAELRRDPEEAGAMTEAIQVATDTRREIARATWETMCVNGGDPQGRPYKEAIRLLWEVEA